MEDDADDEKIAAIRADIARFLVDNSLAPLPEDDLPGDFNILDSGVVDSVLILDLVTHLEDRFGVHLGPNDIVAENFSNLDGIVALVIRLHVS